MTALTQYQRLETEGIWRADTAAQRRDIVVSFGDATLVISDSAGRPLTHWSLAAVVRQNPGRLPAVFALDAEATETLEIADKTMIAAIEKVCAALARARPKPGKLRHLSTATIIVGLIAGAVFWLPGALTRQTMSVVPLSKRSEIGATVLGHLQGLTGPTCRGAAGTQSLARMQARLLGADAIGQIVVIPNGIAGAIALPGGIIVINRSIIEQSDDPAAPSGYILAAANTRDLRDPLSDILTDAGLQVTVQLLTTGELPRNVLRDYAKTLVSRAEAAPTDQILLALFDRARVSSTPYAYARDPSGQSTQGLISADPLANRDAPEVLSDGDWIALQGICGS